MNLQFIQNPDLAINSSWGVDLSYFRPSRVISPKGKVSGYELKSYDVKLNSTNNIFDYREGVKLQDQVIVQVAREVLQNFPHAAYTHIYFLSQCQNPKTGTFDCSKPYRITKNEDGQVQITGRAWTDYKQDDGAMKAQGYAKIHLIFYHGFSNRVIRSKSKWQRDPEVIAKF